MKTFYVQSGIGKAKYLVNFHQGTSFYPDGSKFFDVKIFKSKKESKKFITKLKRDGYIENRG